MNAIYAKARKTSGIWLAQYRTENLSIQVESKKYAELLPRFKQALLEAGVKPELPVEIRSEYFEAEVGVMQAAQEAEKAQQVAFVLRRSLVRKMRADGLTQEDIAAILGISHQRVSQLIAS